MGQTNREEARACVGTLQSETGKPCTESAALKELDAEILQTKVQKLQTQSWEFEEAQNELETELIQMATTSAWKLHKSEVTLSQKLDAGVCKQRSLEEGLCKTQVSRKELQKQHLGIWTGDQ